MIRSTWRSLPLHLPFHSRSPVPLLPVSVPLVPTSATQPPLTVLLAVLQRYLCTTPAIPSPYHCNTTVHSPFPSLLLYLPSFLSFTSFYLCPSTSLLPSPLPPSLPLSFSLPLSLSPSIAAPLPPSRVPSLSALSLPFLCPSSCALSLSPLIVPSPFPFFLPFSLLFSLFCSQPYLSLILLPALFCPSPCHLSLLYHSLLHPRALFPCPLFCPFAYPLLSYYPAPHLFPSFFLQGRFY